MANKNKGQESLALQAPQFRS